MPAPAPSTAPKSFRLPNGLTVYGLSANDTLLRQKGTHSFTMGGTWWREQDHYWNSPSGYPRYSFGITAFGSTIFCRM